jgi:hypothetical protein
MRKSTIHYQVWSTQCPAIVGGRIAGGHVQHVFHGSRQVNPRDLLPPGTTLDQLHWMAPLVKKVQQPTTRTVTGSKGNTYTVTTTYDGKVTCDCPGYTYRRTCKHLAP